MKTKLIGWLLHPTDLVLLLIYNLCTEDKPLESRIQKHPIFTSFGCLFCHPSPSKQVTLTASLEKIFQKASSILALKCSVKIKVLHLKTSIAEQKISTTKATGAAVLKR